MLFSLLLLLLAIAIAFFHYLQGIFSATLSAILTIISAVVALSFSEQLASTMANTKIVEDALSISLVLLFAGIYVVLRLLFDSFVPGNVRVPVLADKIGASVMGVIAALFTTGIVAIAGDALPFGAAPGGYSRFETHNVDGQLESVGGRAQVDETSESAMVSNDLSPTSSTKDHITFWQDDLVVGAMNKLSSGALAGDVPFDYVHPDFLDELYGQRIGIQIGAKHTLFSPENSALSVQGVYTTDQPIPQLSFDYVEMALRTDPLAAKLAPADTSSQSLLIVRMVIGDKDDAADADGVFRFSPGSVRLVAGTPDVGYLDYHPVAELDPSGSALALRADDYLLSSMSTANKTIDLIFIVDTDHLLPGPDGKPSLLGPGSFLQVKRYAVADLANTKLTAGFPTTNPDKTPVVLAPNIATYFAKLPAGPTVAPSVAPGVAPSAGATSPRPPAQVVAPSAGGATPVAPTNPATPSNAPVLCATITDLSNVNSALLIDNGRTLVDTTAHDQVGLWNLADGRQLGVVAVDPTPTFVAASADGTLGATGSPSNALILLNFQQRAVTGKTMLGNTVTSAVFSADGKTVAAANAFGAIFFVDVATHQKQRKISPGLSGAVRLFASPDRSQFLAVGQGEDMYLCGFSDASPPIKLHGHVHQNETITIPTAAISPDGSLIASGGADGTVRLWNAATGALADTYDLQSGAVASVAFSPDSHFVAAATEQSFQILTTTGHKTVLTHSSSALAIAFTPDGKAIMTGDATGATAWDAQTGTAVNQMPVKGGVNGFMFSPDGKYIVLFSPDGTARVTQ